MRIDPKLVIEFVAIAEEGSFTRAAQRLRVAQPWLSARLHKLENLLGFRLLNRTTRTVTLTARGADFLQAARLLAQASKGVDELALQLRRRAQRLLRVGAPPYTTIIRQRSALISAFADAHPDVQLELETGWSHALMGRLDSGDIEITFIMGSHWPARFDRIVLKRLGLALTVSREHPMAGAVSLRPESVAGELIHVFPRSINPELWDELYSPLIDAHAQLIERPGIGEGAPTKMSGPEEITAFYDFGDDYPVTLEAVHIPLETSVAVPFQLMRRNVTPSPEARAFWDLALATAWEHL